MRNVPPLPMLKSAAAPALLLALSACALDGPIRETGYSACHVLGSSDWKAHVELSATDSPIPYMRRKLVVTGKVTTAGGYSASLAGGPVSKLDEPVQQMMVRTEGAAEPGATPVTHNVRAVIPGMKRYGGVAIRCGDGIIAEISDVPAPPRHEREDPFSL